MRSNGCRYRWKDPECRGRKHSYTRVIFLLLLLILSAFWLDHFFRSEFGIAEKFAQLAKHRWGSGALIIGGCLYILTLSLPFVPGVELGVLLMCVFGKPGIVFVRSGCPPAPGSWSGRVRSTHEDRAEGWRLARA